MERKDPNLDVETVAEEPTDSKNPIKKNLLIFVLVGIIVVLALALIITTTPLRDVFLTAKTVPEVTLELVEGPELEESGQYRFDVEAVVSGNPVPEVTFSRDDSLGKAGENRAVIFLNPGESFALTAVARNSQGRREASLTLTAAIETAENGEKDEGVTEPENLGTIEGHILYPSDHIPDMTIVAEDVDKGHKYEADEIIQDSKYATGYGFMIQIPPGNYHVYAIKPGDDFKAYYDEYMESNFALDSYVKILITIAAGDHVDGVIVGNWWKAPQHEEEPPDEPKEEEEANRPPKITGITMMGTYYTGLAYGMSVIATDPDGDPLSYSWSVDDGSIDDPTSSAITWTMPGTGGFYNITVTVEDGRGGQAERTETVEVLALPTISLDQIPGGGFIISDSLVTHELNILVGDSNGNKAIRGYLSFDISGLAGKMILSAEMRFNKYHKYGNPFGLIEKIWVESVYWGTEYIQVDDNLPGVMLGEYDIPTFTCSGEKLVDELSQALGNGHDRFQVRLRHKGYNTNHNDTQDAIQYGGNFPVEFIVTYLP